MGNAKAEEPFSEIELPEYEPPRYEPTHGHREEDQTPLVRYSSTSRTLYDPNRGVLPYTKASHTGCRALLAIIIMLAIVIGIPVGVNKYTTSVSSWRISLLHEFLLNMIIGIKSTLQSLYSPGAYHSVRTLAEHNRRNQADSDTSVPCRHILLTCKVLLITNIELNPMPTCLHLTFSLYFLMKHTAATFPVTIGKTLKVSVPATRPYHTVL